MSVPIEGAGFSPILILEALFSSALLFVAAGAIFPLLRRIGGEGTVTVNAWAPEGKIYAIGFLVAAALLMRFRRDAWSILRAQPELWLLPTLAILSSVWSTDPLQTLRSAIALTGCMLFGLYLGVRFNSSTLLGILSVTLGTIIALSVLAAVVEPSIGIDRGLHQGVWRGVFGHKNLFGRAAALAFTVYALLGMYRQHLRPLAILLSSVALLMVWLSDSRTSAVIVAVMIVYFLARPILRRVTIRTWMIGAVVLSLVIGLGLFVWSQRTDFTRGDIGAETLTGRTLLWGACLLKIVKYPLLGYGYGAFWAGKADEYLDVWRIINWSAPNAHNGFLDATLDLGFLGLLLLLWAYTRTWARALALHRQSGLSPIEQVWPGAVVTFTLLAFITEGQLLFNHVYWILFTAAAVVSVRLAPCKLPETELLHFRGAGGALLARGS